MVEIADDFTAPGTMPDKDVGALSEDDIRRILESLKMDELKLLYVAMTRARTELAIPHEIRTFLNGFRSLSELHWSGARPGQAGTVWRTGSA
jgi:hypothetical protein